MALKVLLEQEKTFFTIVVLLAYLVSQLYFHKCSERIYLSSTKTIFYV